MKHKILVAVCVFGFLPASVCSSLAAANLPSQVTPHSKQQLTPAAAGPYHVERSQIVDSKGRPFLMRGTQLTEFHLQTAAQDNRSGDTFGAHSATSLSAVRLRFNMNTVRLPVNVLEADAPGYFTELAKVVRRANELELLVVLAAREPGAALPTQRTVEFWSHCAAYFKDYPNVIFDAFSDPLPSASLDAHSPEGWAVWRDSLQGVVQAIRSTGARQPVAAMSWRDDRSFEGLASLIDDPNVVYEVSPRYASTRTDADRDAHFGFLATRAPVFVNGWDLDLDDAAECTAIPADPTAATQLVQANLDYADAHGISWTVSVFEPGKLIKDLSFHDATTLENGWSCGHPVYPFAGLGRVVEGHLRSSEERGLFVVSGSGGLDIARGGFALAYGPIMAEHDAKSTGPHPPISLGKISIQVTDALGVSRPAGILWASAGWGQTNFVIPKDLALGPARMTIVREDGSSTGANITIAETAPGFVTGHSCRGPAVGSVIQVYRSGRRSVSALSACKGIHCATLTVPMTSGATTQVRLLSTGFRNVKSKVNIEVTIAGVRVPVVSYQPDGSPGADLLTVEIPASLRGLGETDLICHVNGRISNSVRIRIGGEKPVS